MEHFLIKLRSFLSLIVLFFGNSVMVANAQNIERNGIWYQLQDLNQYGNGYIANVINYYIIDDMWYYFKYKGDIVIPDVITYEGIEYETNLNNYVIYDCDELTSVTIPRSVSWIDESWFQGCRNLKVINVSPDNKWLCSLGGIVYDKEKTSLLRCPQGITGTVEISQNVTYIASSAFLDCVGLTSIVLPKTLQSIGESAFKGCTGLTSISLPEGLLDIYKNAFEGCTGLTNIAIPNTVTRIETGAFRNCVGLREMFIPASVTCIGTGAFADCTNLVSLEADKNNKAIFSEDGVLYTSGNIYLSGNIGRYNIWMLHTLPAGYEGKFSIPASTNNRSVQAIGSYAFSGCQKLAGVEMGDNLQYICSYAFLGCTSIDTLVVGNNVKDILGHAFDSLSCKLFIDHPINFYFFDQSYNGTDYTSIFKGMKKDAVVYAPLAEIKKIKSMTSRKYIYGEGYMEYRTTAYDGIVLPIDFPFGIYQAQEKYKSVSFSIAKNVLNTYDATLEKVLYNGEELLPDENGLYHIRRLLPSHLYNVVISYKEGNTEKNSTQVAYTKIGVINMQNVSSTQTTIRVSNLTVPEDDDVKCIQKGVKIVNMVFNANAENMVIADSLKPNNNYSITLFAKYDDDTEFTDSHDIKTASLYPRFKEVKESPTAINCEVSYVKGDADVVGLFIDDTEVSEGHLLITGLEPGGQYNKKLTVKVKGKNNEVYEESTSYTFKTSKISFENLPPKVTASGIAVVAATTNIIDEETGVGFEWRKTDAPSTVPSKQGVASIYEGTMEGLLKNLQTNAFYNVRPYYKSRNNVMHYGEWIGIDPSDFSYFEPTVHTYDKVDVKEGVAILTGYVMEGSDEILEQGFEYWTSEETSRHASFSPKNVQIVTATGQRMVVEVTGLESNTTYYFRAYVKTGKGTIYGEERTFTTPVSTGIEDVLTEPAIISCRPFNVYSLSGKEIRHQTTTLEGLRSGIYIVNRKKIMVK